MPFPSVLSTFNRPNPTDRLNSPSHSALHNTVSSAVGQLEAVIGVEGANSVVGTLEYFIKSPDSDGGGHVQSAVKGGTGQTTFQKGDILVATNPSVLSKLAVSSTAGEVLVIDPNQSTGMKWGPVISNKIAVNNSSISATTGVSSGLTVLYAASILGSILSTSNAINFKGILQNFGITNGDNFTLTLNYGANSVASMNIQGASSLVSQKGVIQGTIVANGSSVQTGYIQMDTFINTWGAVNNPRFNGLSYGNSSINSSANQDLIITAKYGGAGNNNSILTGLFVVERIA